MQQGSNPCSCWLFLPGLFEVFKDFGVGGAQGNQSRCLDHLWNLPHPRQLLRPQMALAALRVGVLASFSALSCCVLPSGVGRVSRLLCARADSSTGRRRNRPLTPARGGCTSSMGRSTSGCASGDGPTRPGFRSRGWPAYCRACYVWRLRAA